MKTPFWLFIWSIILSGVAAGQERPLKILSYNILNGMKLDESADKAAFTAWLKGVDCDILALQEAQQFTPKSLEEMARKFSHPYAVLLKEDGYPTALTSKYPIVRVRKVIDNMHHGFIQAEINGYNVMVIHLSPHKYWKRREEVDLILTTIRSERPAGKWILMGDFNAESPLDADMYKDGKLAFDRKRAQDKYPVHDNLVDGALDFEAIGKILSAEVVEVVRLKSSGRLWGQPTSRFAEIDGRAVPRRVDYIFIGKDTGIVVAAGILKDKFTDMYSDHYPVWLELAR
jgi:exodeoxyribonuclease III